MNVNHNAATRRKTFPMSRGACSKMPERSLFCMRALVHELREEVGTLAAVSAVLGISESYIYKVHRIERFGVGMNAIRRACTRLRLREDYFCQAEPIASYREFLQSREAAADDGPSVDHAALAGDALLRARSSIDSAISELTLERSQLALLDTTRALQAAAAAHYHVATTTEGRR